MAPPRIPKDVITLIESVWAENPDQTATNIFNEFRRHHPTQKIGIRKTQSIIAELKKEYGHRAYPLAIWRPWRDEHESSEDTAYLLALDAATMADSGRHLWQHEAKWGRRIRSALDGLNPSQRGAFIAEYARREQTQFVLRRDRAYTSDLDGILAYRPWIAGHRPAYEAALDAGAIGPSPRPGWWDFVRGLDRPYHTGP
jgi:hypothetical protein